ncbi:hypothetical protein F2Q69_00048966 [Brassica cretica]|uniref:Uncharacterized protein n=1 Tax=Brassica cretica TaxID=69181 RepID=A0A8S9Q311_BRACR|nr:hypothetical protein F2Q69_00048966 [Brassica cretica]
MSVSSVALSRMDEEDVDFCSKRIEFLAFQICQSTHGKDLMLSMSADRALELLIRKCKLRNTEFRDQLCGGRAEASEIPSQSIFMQGSGSDGKDLRNIFLRKGNINQRYVPGTSSFNEQISNFKS